MTNIETYTEAILQILGFVQQRTELAPVRQELEELYKVREFIQLIIDEVRKENLT